MQEGRPWILKLVAVSCVILALKMRKAEFSVSDIQVNIMSLLKIFRRTLKEYRHFDCRISLSLKKLFFRQSGVYLRCGEIYCPVQEDGGVTFDLQTIERMEMLILGTLKWRMRSVTPFSFLNFFISFFKFKEPPLRQALKARATEIIFKSQTGKYIKFNVNYRFNLHIFLNNPNLMLLRLTFQKSIY